MAKRPSPLALAVGETEESTVDRNSVIDLLTLESLKELVRTFKLGRLDSRKEVLKDFVRKCSEIDQPYLIEVLDDQSSTKRKRVKAILEDTVKSLANLHVGDKVHWNERTSGAKYRFGIIVKKHSKFVFLDEYEHIVLSTTNTPSETTQSIVPNWTRLRSTNVKIKALSVHSCSGINSYLNCTYH
jgi:hypothetical protein